MIKSLSYVTRLSIKEGTMDQEESKKKPIDQQSSEEKTSDTEQMMKWRDSAFKAAVEKLQETSGNPETVMQTGEAFGRGLFEQQLKEKSPEWTMTKWLEKTEEDVFKPLGTEFTFTKISDDIAATFVNRDPLRQVSKESTVASLFNYGVMRGLFLSAFPKGELLCHENSIADQQEFIFKTHASARDRFERERVKRAFSAVKRDDGV
jgi:hypothetical protein